MARRRRGRSQESDGLVDFFTEQIVEFLFRFLSESLVNMIYAFMWPVYVVQLNPPWGAIGLGLAFLFFDTVLRKPIERWLNAGTDAQAPQTSTPQD